MNRPLKVGVTGGIGSGKSTICKIFEVLGIPIYDSDNRARWLMENDSALQVKLIEQFGQNTVSKGKLNRDFLASQVFGNTEKLNQLNGIVHPAVALDSDAWYKQNENAPYVIKEAALLIETNIYKSLDKLIVVMADKNERIDRILKRDLYRSESEIEKIMESQTTDEQRKSLADYLIFNGAADLVLPRVLEIHNQLSGNF